MGGNRNMSGKTDLKNLLKEMQPVLHESPFVFCSVDKNSFDQLPFEPLSLFFEAEGVSLIITEEQANHSDLPYDSIWACITLNVHSSLTAIGFLAAITGKLAEAGISVNPVSAYYHDHLFVPWEWKEVAIEALHGLSGKA
jgi:hypothetical protein